MRDHYETLGIPRNASERMVQLAFEGKMKALADPDYAASARERSREETRLREAFATLSHPLKRVAYDARLAAADTGGDDDAEGWLTRGRLALIAILLVVVAGGWIWNERLRAREREEIARADRAREEARQAVWKERAEAAEARREAQRLEEEAGAAAGRQWQERTDLERERAASEAQRRAQEAQAVSAEAYARDRESLARAARERAEQQALSAEEEKRRAAQMEVERQKAYLRGLELDEERARAARHEQALREAREREYQRQLEESRKAR
jgi:colicin import membrane protein